jgi:hypothetical protein
LASGGSLTAAGVATVLVAIAGFLPVVWNLGWFQIPYPSRASSTQPRASSTQPRAIGRVPLDGEGIVAWVTIRFERTTTPRDLTRGRPAIS